MVWRYHIRTIVQPSLFQHLTGLRKTGYKFVGECVALFEREVIHQQFPTFYLVILVHSTVFLTEHPFISCIIQHLPHSIYMDVCFTVMLHFFERHELLKTTFKVRGSEHMPLLALLYKRNVVVLFLAVIKVFSKYKIVIVCIVKP